MENIEHCWRETTFIEKWWISEHVRACSIWPLGPVFLPTVPRFISTSKKMAKQKLICPTKLIKFRAKSLYFVPRPEKEVCAGFCFQRESWVELKRFCPQHNFHLFLSYCGIKRPSDWLSQNGTSPTRTDKCTPEQNNSQNTLQVVCWCRKVQRHKGKLLCIWF